MRNKLCTLKYSKNGIIIVTPAKTVHQVLWHYVHVILVFDTSLDSFKLNISSTCNPVTCNRSIMF